MEELPPEGLIAGKYRLTRLLGRGGMGSVWEGIHTSLGNRVACKFIEPEHVGSQDALRRFENEARAAASLKSKHVVDVYDHGVTPDGRPYIVMEFLAGESLDSRLEKRGVLNIQEVATIVLQVSRALSRAHQNGIVHRDLKPENVFLVWDEDDQTDVVKVVDFGIAKFVESDASGISSSTKTGSILGTPYYMSPEQARGLKNLDARSDNWSLGVIAFEALTGHRPFVGEAVGDLLVKICTTDPAVPSHLQPNLPPDIDHWMRKALTREPDHRFQTAQELADALVTIAGLPGRVTLGSTVEPGRRASLLKTDRYVNGQLTSGALTGAALETNIEPVVRAKKPATGLYAAVAAFICLGVGGYFIWGGSDDAADGSPATETASSSDEPNHPAKTLPSSAPPAAVEDTSKVPAPETAKPLTATSSPSESGQATPSKNDQTSEVAPRPALPSQPPQPRPRPSGATTAPPPSPQPAPRPTPAAGFDLGY